MILVNGCPKHGTHALLKAVELLGQDAGDVWHCARGDRLPDGVTKHLFIFRDPRDGLVSWIRQQGKVVTDGTFMAAVRNGEYLKILRSFVGWMRDDSAFKVCYEDLVKDDKALRAIAGFLGVPYLESAFPNLPGLTITWHPIRSNFRQVWTPAVESVWRDAGGDDLVTEFGY